MPDDFVRLSEAAPTVRQDIRYFGADNFTGAPVPGYEAPQCVLTRPAAAALAKVQTELADKGYELIVFDCYRPEKAVAAFMDWSRSDNPGKPYFYPGIEKSAIIPDGYVAERSGHSRGSTVDLGIVRLDRDTDTFPPRAQRCDESSMSSLGLEMGTDFDCFSPRSATATEEVSEDAQANRKVLLDAMTDAGFVNYPKEWWHYTLGNEPYPDRYFDFDVE
ncbi:M15 family metallopeptidase [Amorphus sp. 3PC139-8]